MSFAAPLMLLGLGLLGPLFWLHLKRRPTRTVAFPTLFILQRVLKRQQKKSRVREWVILIIRALLVVTFSVALARPALTVWRPGGIRSGLPLSQVILLDDSASMQRRIPTPGQDETTAFERARQMAITELGRLRPQDSVAVILAGKPPRLITDGLTTDKEQVSMRLYGLHAGYAADAIDDAIYKAEHLLAKSSSAQKEILLITDLAGTPVHPETMKQMQTVFRVVGVTPATQKLENIAISDVAVLPAGGPEAREVTIRAEIINYSSSRQNVDVSLSLDGKPVARGLLKVAPWQTGIKDFHHRFDEKGIHFGQVEVGANVGPIQRGKRDAVGAAAVNDVFAVDNIRYLATNVRRSINVLVINGDARPGSYLDEAFYLQKALETPIPGEVPIHIQIMEPDMARVTPLESYDVIFLAGVTTLSSGLWERLVRYVEEGGGLFVSAGKGKPDENLQSVMPGEVDGIRKSDRRSHLKVGAVKLSHPIFHTLGEQSTGLENVKIKNHLLLKPNPAVEREVLVQLADGLPLLLERKIGKGTTLLLTTTIDRDWSDLPIRPGFLPLIQRSTRYLSRSLAFREPRTIDVGKTVSLPVVEGMQKLIVLSPSKKRTVFSANRLTGQANIWFRQTNRPGPWRVFAEMPESGGLTELQSSAFVTNVASSESDLSRKMKESGDLSRDDRDRYTALEGKLPVWSHLLMVALFLLFVETILVGMGLRKSHRKPIE
ncbi:MAG: BatA domain-containing protein [Deltaproteobacteria bacterium]|nr:BatA domain-containing protein [Deltaproteobacteria bacterium]